MGDTTNNNRNMAYMQNDLKKYRQRFNDMDTDTYDHAYYSLDCPHHLIFHKTC